MGGRGGESHGGGLRAERNAPAAGVGGVGLRGVDARARVPRQRVPPLRRWLVGNLEILAPHARWRLGTAAGQQPQHAEDPRERAAAGLGDRAGAARGGRTGRRRPSSSGALADEGGDGQAPRASELRGLRGQIPTSPRRSGPRRAPRAGAGGPGRAPTGRRAPRSPGPFGAPGGSGGQPRSRRRIPQPWRPVPAAPRRREAARASGSGAHGGGP